MGPAELFVSAAITAAAVVPIAAAIEGQAPRTENAPPILAERFTYRSACPQAEGGPCVVDLVERRELVD